MLIYPHAKFVKCTQKITPYSNFLLPKVSVVMLYLVMELFFILSMLSQRIRYFFLFLPKLNIFCVILRQAKSKSITMVIHSSIWLYNYWNLHKHQYRWLASKSRDVVFSWFLIDFCSRIYNAFAVLLCQIKIIRSDFSPYFCTSLCPLNNPTNNNYTYNYTSV